MSGMLDALGAAEFRCEHYLQSMQTYYQEPVFAVVRCGDRWSILAPCVRELSGRFGVRRTAVANAPRSRERERSARGRRPPLRVAQPPRDSGRRRGLRAG
jgi:hypothetical protein